MKISRELSGRINLLLAQLQWCPGNSTSVPFVPASIMAEKQQYEYMRSKIPEFRLTLLLVTVLQELSMLS